MNYLLTKGTGAALEMTKFTVSYTGKIVVADYKSIYTTTMEVPAARTLYKRLLDEGYKLDNTELDGFEFMYRCQEDMFRSCNSALKATIASCY